MDKENDKQGSNTDPEIRHYSVSPVVSNPSNPGDQQNQADKAEAETTDEPPPYRPPKAIKAYFRWERRRKNWPSVITVVISFIALLVIIAQAIIYAKQAQIMRQTVAEAKISRETEHRAYVGVKSMILKPVPSLPGESNVVLTLINTGKAPASGTVDASFFLAETSPPDDYDLAKHLRRSQPPVQLVFLPQAEIVFSTKETVPNEKFTKTPTPDQVSRWQNSVTRINPDTRPLDLGRAKFFVIGVISYQDVFRNPHMTTFCYYADSTRRRGEVVFAICDTFNSFN